MHYIEHCSTATNYTGRAYNSQDYVWDGAVYELQFQYTLFFPLAHKSSKPKYRQYLTCSVASNAEKSLEMTSLSAGKIYSG